MIDRPEVGGDMRIPITTEFIVQRLPNEGEAERYMTESGRVIFVSHAEISADPVNAREIAVRRWMASHLRG